MVQPPLDPQTSECRIGGWTITSRTGPISNSADTEAICDAAGVSPPTMLFGDSYLELSRPGFSLRFDAAHALEHVHARDPALHVRGSASWKARPVSVALSAPPATSSRDWTYTTSYRGTLSHTTPTTSALAIDQAALADRTLPIRHFAAVPLYEDELDDNGAATYRVRLRCMPGFFFILARFYLRIDDVLLRVYDTRYYHRYDTDVLIQQCTQQQVSYDALPASLHGPLLRDADMVAAELSILHRETTHLSLTPPTENGTTQ